jgi:hypothetical protein
LIQGEADEHKLRLRRTLQKSSESTSDGNKSIRELTAAAAASRYSMAPTTTSTIRALANVSSSWTTKDFCLSSHPNKVILNAETETSLVVNGQASTPPPNNVWSYVIDLWTSCTATSALRITSAATFTANNGNMSLAVDNNLKSGTFVGSGNLTLTIQAFRIRCSSTTSRASCKYRIDKSIPATILTLEASVQAGWKAIKPFVTSFQSVTSNGVTTTISEKSRVSSSNESIVIEGTPYQYPQGIKLIKTGFLSYENVTVVK